MILLGVSARTQLNHNCGAVPPVRRHRWYGGGFLCSPFAGLHRCDLECRTGGRKRTGRLERGSGALPPRISSPVSIDC